jgi:aspartate racemase
MKSKSIGIIGGAGPLAGSLLLERVFALAGKKYGCCKDTDFPKVFLISFPFSEMLSSDRDASQLRNELNACLLQLRQNGASVLAIACNTLHAFLDEKNDLGDLVHLPRAVAAEMTGLNEPLVLCTSTSVEYEVHRQFFPCIYPDAETQVRVDEIIDQILKGVDQGLILKKLEELIHAQTTNNIVLGCTELSLFSAHLSSRNKLLIDPIEIVANKLLEIIFK